MSEWWDTYEVVEVMPTEVTTDTTEKSSKPSVR